MHGPHTWQRPADANSKTSPGLHLGFSGTGQYKQPPRNSGESLVDAGHHRRQRRRVSTLQSMLKAMAQPGASSPILQGVLGSLLNPRKKFCGSKNLKLLM
jgi:hypothetical protein